MIKLLMTHDNASCQAKGPVHTRRAGNNGITNQKNNPNEQKLMKDGLITSPIYQSLQHVNLLGERQYLFKSNNIHIDYESKLPNVNAWRNIFDHNFSVIHANIYSFPPFLNSQINCNSFTCNHTPLINAHAILLCWAIFLPLTWSQTLNMIVVWPA